LVGNISLKGAIGGYQPMNNIDIIRREVNINGKIFRSTYLENYYASIDGCIVQVYYDADNVTIKKIFLMKQEIVSGGYRRVQGPNHSGHHSVHRLVYSAWGIDMISPYLVIDHIDADPANNNISNLRQVTQKENIQNAIFHGNFNRNGTKKIRVHDFVTNTDKDYDSVKDFLVDIGAPEYMIKHNCLSGIRKRSEYNRYQYITIQES
jgi:hypothetical protein